MYTYRERDIYVYIHMYTYMHIYTYAYGVILIYLYILDVCAEVGLVLRQLEGGAAKGLLAAVLASWRQVYYHDLCLM